jgi:translation elongation factor EF-Ts
VASEGVVASYIHAGGKIGVLVEVDCETDFVARTDQFQEFARDVALHVAAQPLLRYVSEDDVPADVREAELRVLREQAAADGDSRSPTMPGATVPEVDGHLEDLEELVTDQGTKKPSRRSSRTPAREHSEEGSQPDTV